jgi:hypothetical protein
LVEELRAGWWRSCERVGGGVASGLVEELRAGWRRQGLEVGHECGMAWSWRQLEIVLVFDGFMGGTRAYRLYEEGL